MNQPPHPHQPVQHRPNPVPNPVPPPQVPLILSEQPVSASDRAAVQPGRALLFSDGSGQLVRLGKQPNMLTAWRYGWRYEVDLADHFTALHLEVPSRSKAARFQLTVDVGWRVTDPVRIVNSRIMDGNAIVQSRVIEALLPICRAYDIEQDGELEQNLAGALGGGRTHEYPEGITLFRFSAQVNHDQKAAERIAALVDASHEATIVKEGMAGLREQVTSEVDLILMSLQRNPEQVHQVIADIRQRKEMSDKSRIELFNKMVDNDLIQEAEIDSLRQQIIQPIGDIVGSTPTGVFGTQELPVPERPAVERAASRPDEDEDEDILPAEIVESSVDGVSHWRPAPWQKSPEQGDS